MNEVAESDWEARARRAEASLDEVLAERGRLWEELHRRTARDRELQHCRELVAQLERSASWRLTAPLRKAKRVAQSVRKLRARPRRIPRSS